MFLFFTQVKFDVSGRELAIPPSDYQYDGDDDEGYVHEVVQRMLAAKDEGLVSDKAYHELRMALLEKVRSHVPPLSAIKQERRSQNKEIKVIQIPKAKQADGAWRSVRDVLQYLIAIPEVKDAIKKDGSKIKLRFAADGRRTSKRIGTVMAVFNILCENKATYEYQYTLALYNGKEDYEELKACLGHTFQEIDELKAEGVSIDGEHFDVEWYCCSDWKFLALVYGLNGASSKYFCIWCYCCKDQINNLDIDDWPIERKLSECTWLCQHSTTAARKGYKMPPLLNIPFEFVVVDTLHLFLRIMGVLFHQVVEVVVNNDCPDILSKEMERIQVEFKFYDEYNRLAEKTETKWTSLNGKELQKVLEKLDIKNVMEAVGTKDAEGIDNLWKGFQTLMQALQVQENDPDYLEPQRFKTYVREWGKLFLEMYYDDDITPYIHTFVYHVPQFLEMHGTLMQFNCQPVEKKNHWQSQAFHRGSQKSVRTFRLWQIIQLFSSTVALFTNASKNCVNFVSAMLIEHRPLPALYQKSCIIFTDILTANYILEIGR